MSEQFIRELSDEVGQEVVRGLITQGTVRRVASGATPRNAVLETIRDDVLSDTSPFMQAARTVATRLGPRVVRLGPTVAATALASMIRRWNIADSIMAGDNSPVASMLRTIVRALPSATIGTGLALGDMAVNWVSGVVDDPTKPEDQRNGQIDRVVRTRLLPGRVFMAAFDSSGQIRRYNDGVPMCNDQAWIQVYDMWREANPTRRENRGRGRNQQPVEVPGNPFPWDVVPMDQAAQALDAAAVGRVDLAEIRRVLGGGNTSWAAQINDGSWLVLDAMIFESLSQGIRGRFAVDFQEDLAANSVDPTLINTRLARFVPLVQVVGGVPRFTDRMAYRVVSRVLDTFTKTELVAGNKILRALLDGYDAARDWGWNPVSAGIWAAVISAPIWVSSFLLLATFMLGVGMFLKGFATPAAGMVTLHGNTVPGNFAATVLMAVGYFLVFVVSWFPPLWRKILEIVPFAGKPGEGLTSLGRRIGSTALIVGGACAFAGWLGIPVMYRILAPVAFFLPVGTSLAMADAGRGELVKAKLARNVHYIEWAFGLVPLGTMFICGMIAAHTGTFVTGLTLLGMVTALVAKVIVASKWLSVGLVCLLGVVGSLIIYRMSTRFVVHRGVTVRISNPKVPFLGLCFAGLMAALIVFIFVAEPAEKMKIPQIVDPKVSVTDITTVDASTGAKMREKTVVHESGQTTTLRKGTVVHNAPSAPSTKPPVDCSKPLPVDVRKRLCSK